MSVGEVGFMTQVKCHITRFTVSKLKARIPLTLSIHEKHLRCGSCGRYCLFRHTKGLEISLLGSVQYISATGQFHASTLEVSKPACYLADFTFMNLLLFLLLVGSRHHNVTKIAMTTWLSFLVDFLQVWNGTPEMSCNPISPAGLRLNTLAFDDNNFSNYNFSC